MALMGVEGGSERDIVAGRVEGDDWGVVAGLYREVSARSKAPAGEVRIPAVLWIAPDLGC